MQLRFETPLTLDEYLTERGWEQATLRCCPLHPAGGCGWSWHGTYLRKRPVPTPIARAYCPAGHTTFSFLPDFFASRLPGTLGEVEHVAATVEAAPSIEKAADTLRSGTEPDAVTLAAAVRWTARRIALFAAVLVGVFADELTGVRTVADLRERLDTSHALVGDQVTGFVVDRTRAQGWTIAVYVWAGWAFGAALATAVLWVRTGRRPAGTSGSGASAAEIEAA